MINWLKRLPWTWILAIAFCLLCWLAVFQRAYGDTNKLLKPFSKEWLSDQSIKHGTMLSYCFAQSMTGITEGYKFNGNSGYLMNEDNYHAYQAAMRVGWLGAGFMSQAALRSPHRTFGGKIKRVIGSALVARDFFEWSYKWQRYNNPFDNDPAHNKHSIVYVGIRNGGAVDLYISTGRTTTPLVDVAFLALGLWLWE